MEECRVTCYFPKKNEDAEKDLQRFANLVRDLVIKYHDQINDEKSIANESE